MKNKGVKKVKKAKRPKVDKSRIGQTARKIAVSVVMILLLFTGFGVSYTWFYGNEPAEEVPLLTDTVVTAIAPAVKPRIPSATAQVSAAVRMLTTPIEQGSNASITVSTLAGSACNIRVEYNKEASTDSGLIPKIADEFGIVTWTWTVETSRPVGKWPVDVTCAFNDRSAFVRGDLVIEKMAN